MVQEFLQGTLNPSKIYANIFISFIGSGILSLPYSFKESGVLEGLVILILVAVLSIKAMKLLVDCKYRILSVPLDSPLLDGSSSDGSDNEVVLYHSEKQEKPGHVNYGTIGFQVMGTLGQWLVNVCLTVSQIGFCCAYLIFIMENLSTFLPFLNKQIWLPVLLPGLFLLTLLRQLDRLAVFSFFAQLSTIFALAIVFWFDFEHIRSVALRLHPKQYSLRGFPLFFSIALYSYEGAGMILALEESLAPQVRHRFYRYLVVSLAGVTLLYATFGIAGYMSFGEHTSPIITLNLPTSNGVNFAMLVKLCLCVSLYFTYPVMMFPVTRLLESLCPSTPTYTQQVAIRAGAVTLTGIVVVLIPTFTTLLGLIGASCCVLLAFVLPGYFHLRLLAGSLARCDKLFDISLVVFGLIGMVVGLLDVAQRALADISLPSNSTLTPTLSISVDPTLA